jgi:uncharacterized membrane protein HdeD (DUF308 family)
MILTNKGGLIMLFAIEIVLLVLGIIQTIYNFVKKEFEKGTLHLILSISFALIVFFDGDTLWFKIGTIMLFGTIIFQIYKAYK